MTEILHAKLPEDMHDARPLPNIRPVAGPWLRVDEAYAGQMARREALLDTVPREVLYCPEAAMGPALELLDLVLPDLPPLGFEREGDVMLCPDGRRVPIERAAPLATLGRLLQCDFCLHAKEADEHVLKAAVLCFPASWVLAEKVNRPLSRIHKPIDVYDANLARRVQRLFDGVQPGRPLWRFNRLFYGDAELYQPLGESDPRRQDRGAPHFLRAERQTLVRLPVSRWIVFAIHTYVLPAEAVQVPVTETEGGYPSPA